MDGERGEGVALAVESPAIEEVVDEQPVGISQTVEVADEQLGS